MEDVAYMDGDSFQTWELTIETPQESVVLSSSRPVVAGTTLVVRVRSQAGGRGKIKHVIDTNGNDWVPTVNPKGWSYVWYADHVLGGSVSVTLVFYTPFEGLV